MNVLTVNLGNSAVDIGLFGRDGTLIFKSSLSSNVAITEDEHCIRFKDVLTFRIEASDKWFNPLFCCACHD